MQYGILKLEKTGWKDQLIKPYLIKKKSILFLGGNFYPELTGIGKYNGEMIAWLSEHSYQCSVITTYPYYPSWKVQTPYAYKSFWYKKEKQIFPGGIPINLYRCPHYVPQKPSGIKRILSDSSFFLSALFKLLILLFSKKYDYVMVVAPPFQLGLLGVLYQKIKGAKFIYHMQDLQIDAASELGMIKSKILIRAMFGIERYIIMRADYVSSISEGMIKKIKNKCKRSVILFPNWVDTKAFYPISQKEDLKTKFNFLPTDKIVLYSGAIGEKQGLQTLLQSAKELSYKQNIKFVVCGYGPYKQKLMEQSKKMALQNVFFMPLQPKESFNAFLNMADIHLVLQKADTNDLVMPSKLTTILSIGGLAIITAESNTSLFETVEHNNIGIIIQPEDRKALTDSILAALEEEHNHIILNARNYAEQFLSIDKVFKDFFIMEV